MSHIRIALLCKFGSSQCCEYGEKCKFAHTLEELEAKRLDLAALQSKRRREQNGVCNSFLITNACPYGSKCRFAHASPEEALIIEQAIVARNLKRIEKRAKREAKSNTEIRSTKICGCCDDHTHNDQILNDSENWIALKIRSCPIYLNYSHIFENSILILQKWKLRFASHPEIWSRFTKGNGSRLIKELCEAIPIIDKVLNIVNSIDLVESKINIIDLCSGFGFLSMFLSEMLDPSKMNRIVLVDKQWSRFNIHQNTERDLVVDKGLTEGKDRCDVGAETREDVNGNDNNDDNDDNDNNDDNDCIGGDDRSDESIVGNQNVTKTKTVQYISSDHLLGTFSSQWPIPLIPSKQNLKSSATIRSIQKSIISKLIYPEKAIDNTSIESQKDERNRDKESNSHQPNGSNFLIILGIHLCGTLSLRAVDLFNMNKEHVLFFALKPCCLPTMVHAQRAEVFHIGHHHFDSKLVCANGKWVAKSKGVWTGPPRNHLLPKFMNWIYNLMCGCDTSVGDGEEQETNHIVVTPISPSKKEDSLGKDMANRKMEDKEDIDVKQEKANSIVDISQTITVDDSHRNNDTVHEKRLDQSCLYTKDVLISNTYWKKSVQEISLQDIGFQNKYIFVERILVRNDNFG